MDEKVIISNTANLKKKAMQISLIILGVSVILFYLWQSSYHSAGRVYHSAGYYTRWEYTEFGMFCGVLSIIGACLSIPLLVSSFFMSVTELTVTDKRVYGQTAFRKRVDLPLDSISAVGTGMFGRFSVATSSGRINFLGLQNRDEFQKCISDLLIQRNRNTVQDIPKSCGEVEDVKKLKELLDMEIITQEEFEAKKKQILGL